MVSPTAMAKTSIAGSGLGTGLSVASALMGGSSSSKQYAYQAGIAQMNKKIALQNADYAREAGEGEAQAFGTKAAYRQGEIRTTQAASGLNVNSGSNLEVQQSQAKVDAQDMSTIRDNAARRAYGYETEAVNQEAKANAYKMAAKNAKTEGFLGAATSLVSGATSVASKWTQGQQLGLWGEGETSAQTLSDPWTGLREGKYGG